MASSALRWSCPLKTDLSAADVPHYLTPFRILHRALRAALLVALAVGLAHPTAAQIDLVLAEQKVSATEGGFGGALGNVDYFGLSVAFIGDIDGDGVQDLAAGAEADDDGGLDAGAVYVLFLNADGTVKAEQKITEGAGGFSGPLDPFDGFGISVAGLGDLDGDGTEDLAVGAWEDALGFSPRGAVYVLFLNPDGTVKAQQKIGQGQGGFPGPADGVSLSGGGLFGASVARLGDLDGDGVQDLAVGNYFDGNGGPKRGAVWVLFLNADGTVKAEQKITQGVGGFSGDLDFEDRFGRSVAALGDLDGDGVGDLAVGASSDDDGGTDRGAVWILFLNADGTVKAEQKISELAGRFDGSIANGDVFGGAVSRLGDRNGDGVQDLLVGAPRADGAEANAGALWILLLNPDGTVKGEQRLSDVGGGFEGDLGSEDLFGISASNLGDLDGDGVQDLAVGASRDDDGGFDRGAFYVLFLDGQLDLAAQNTSPLTVPAGSSVSFSFTLANANSGVVPARLSYSVRNDNGTVVAQNLIRSGVFSPGQTVSGTFTQQIGIGAAPGTYTYTLNIGGLTYPTIDAEEFTVVVTPPPALVSGNGPAWAVTDVTPWETAGAPGGAAWAVDGSVTASPNPFRQRTALSFSLPAAAHVRLAVYDALGREVALLRDETVEAGHHEAVFDGSSLPSGVYVWRLQADGEARGGRLTLLR